MCIRPGGVADLVTGCSVEVIGEAGHTRIGTVASVSGAASILEVGIHGASILGAAEAVVEVVTEKAIHFVLVINVFDDVGFAVEGVFHEGGRSAAGEGFLESSDAFDIEAEGEDFETADISEIGIEEFVGGSDANIVVRNYVEAFGVVSAFESFSAFFVVKPSGDGTSGDTVLVVDVVLVSAREAALKGSLADSGIIADRGLTTYGALSAINGC